MKTLIIVLVALLFFALGFCATYFYINKVEKNAVDTSKNDVKDEAVVTLEKTEDSIKFKNEMEDLNTVVNEDGTTKYMNITIPEANGVKYASIEDIEALFDGGSGIVYFGFAECPWCRNAVPELIEALSTSGANTIYYMNVLNIRDKKSLDDDGKVVTESEGTSEYKKLLELFGDSLDVYDGLNDDNIRRIYAPTVFFIKDGKVILKHTGTLDEQENPKVPLTSEQKETLRNIYKDGYLKMTEDSFVCDEDRNC